MFCRITVGLLIWTDILCMQTNVSVLFTSACQHHSSPKHNGSSKQWNPSCSCFTLQSSLFLYLTFASWHYHFAATMAMSHAVLSHTDIRLLVKLHRGMHCFVHLPKQARKLPEAMIFFQMYALMAGNALLNDPLLKCTSSSYTVPLLTVAFSLAHRTPVCH